jgi:hypothetical protein
VIRDGCGVTVNYFKDLSFSINMSASQFSDCSNAKLIYEPDGFFTPPVTYSILPDNNSGTNTNGVFIVAPGTYVVSAIDSCGKKTSAPPVTIQRNWQLNTILQSSLCHVGFVSHRIGVPSASLGKLTVAQYAGGMPVASGATPIRNRAYVTLSNGCVSCGAADVSGDWIQFDSTLPAQTYSYIVTDSCGYADTIAITNIHSDSAYRGFFHTARVVNKCINRGDIIASWRNDGPASNTVTVTVLTINHSPIFIYNTISNTNMVAHPNGQTLLSNYPPGSYIVEYSFSDCSVIYADTVSIVAYSQPVVNTVQNIPSCTGNNTVIITGAQGIAPYSYQIINTTPGNFSSTPQPGSVFTMPAAQATATVRIVDACLNSVTRTVAITRAYSPVIRSNPPVFATCTLPLAFMLFTDSLYAGSLFEWKKITGNGAGNTVISSRPFVSLVYNTITDTGTYRVRVSVPGSCYDFTADYRVGPVTITCLASISGTVFNDANGLVDNTVNGRGTDAGGLYVSLINTAGNVSAVCNVASNGSYQFLDVAAGDYSILLSMVAGTVNAPSPASQLPTSWINTGEHTSILPGSDGTINGRLININIGTAAVSNLNFGIERLPLANDTTVGRTNPGGNLRVTVPVFTGSDAEDGVYDGVSGINTVIIQTLPVNAVLYYNGLPVIAGQIIQQYNPSLLTIDPADNIASASFTFSEIDAALQVSVPATVIIVFYGLPVHLTSFTATVLNGKVQLNWQVSEQLNILTYDVETSTDGNNFSVLGSVAAVSASRYAFTHGMPVNGINFYRLKIIESDGSFKYSKIVTAEINKASRVQVLPNPFTNSVQIIVSLPNASPVSTVIFDATGRKIYERTVYGNTGINKFEITSLQHFASGIYMVSVTSNKLISNHRLIKE